MDKGAISNEVRKFLGNHINIEDLAMDEDIFKAGYVNSLFAMQLVMFIENNFGIKVDNEDLEITNFNSVDNLSSFVEKKLQTIGSETDV